jgi:hypothetical protein
MGAKDQTFIHCLKEENILEEKLLSRHGKSFRKVSAILEGRVKYISTGPKLQ